MNKSVSNEDLAGKIDNLASALSGLTELVESTARSTANTLVNMATKDDLTEAENRLNNRIDSVDNKINSLHNRLDINAGLDRKVESLAKDIIEIKQHVGIPA